MAKRDRATDSPLSDLLVVLGTQRYGTDWTNVAAAIRAAIGPLEPLDALPASECEERFRALVEGTPVELPALASKLQARHLETLGDARAALATRIDELCKQLPARHPDRAAFLAGIAVGSEPDGRASGGATQAETGSAASAVQGDPDGRPAARARNQALMESALENELEESWISIAEEEDRNSRRATVAGTLNKMLLAVTKHKWAYPFKRPVTDKEAPDYKDIITNPMDCTHLRDLESDRPPTFHFLKVADIHGLVDDLNLIFDNAMKYNGEGSDYYKMASTLKAVVGYQKSQYLAKKGEDMKGTASVANAPEDSDRAPRRARVASRR